MSVKNAFEGLTAILKGMKITFSYLFKEPVTIQYPDVKRKPSSMFRGRHYLRLWQDGMDRCIACHLCEIVCPAQAIYVKDAKNDKKSPVSKSHYYAEDFQINMLRCIFVGDCEEVCPVDCIILSDDYEVSGYTREEMIYTKEDLIEPHPGASGRDPMLKRGDGRMD